MPVVAALLDGTGALATLRRALSASTHAKVRGCRSGAALIRLVEDELVDAVVLGVKSQQTLPLAAFRRRFATVPVVVYGAFRAEDARLLLELDRLGVAAVLVEGLDDPLVGERIVQSGSTASRRESLANLPRLLRLTEPLQRRAFDLLVGSMGRSPSTAVIARKLKVSREHLSRQFGAGGAPNLKRVVDLLRLLGVRHVMGDSETPMAAAASLYGFSSTSHLRVSIRRTFRLEPDDFVAAARPDLVRRFIQTGARSRA